MIRSLLVALREIRTYLQDKPGLAFGLLLPIATFALMYGAFGGQSQFHGTARMVNEDRGAIYSERLVRELDELENLDVELLSLSEADSKLEKSDLLMVIYIPKGFSDKLAAGEPTQLIFKQRGNGGQEGQIVASLVRGVAEKISREFQIKSQVKDALAGRNISQDHIEITVQKFLEREEENPIVGIEEKAVGAKIEPIHQFLPGIVTMYVLFALTLTARSIVEERKKGTLERLLTTRLSVSGLFFGKFLSSISHGFIQTLILLALAYAAFRIFTPFSFGESLVIALVFACAASALGLIIASVARSADAATWIAVFFTMLMVMLGGTFFEIKEGSVMAAISKISINTYANDAFKTVIVQGGSLADAGFELGVMAGIAVVGLAISRIIFRVIPRGK